MKSRSPQFAKGYRITEKVVLGRALLICSRSLLKASIAISWPVATAPGVLDGFLHRGAMAASDPAGTPCTLMTGFIATLVPPVAPSIRCLMFISLIISLSLEPAGTVASDVLGNMSGFGGGGGAGAFL